MNVKTLPEKTYIIYFYGVLQFVQKSDIILVQNIKEYATMNKKLIAIIVAVVVIVVAVIGVVIVTSKDNNNETPDNGQNKVENTVQDNNDNKGDSQKPEEDKNVAVPDNSDKGDKNDTQDNKPSGGISIGKQEDPTTGDKNNQNNNGDNSNDEPTTDVPRCKYCNKILVATSDPRVNDLDNCCDGDCIGWFG